MYKTYSGGWIEVITGPMFSGKSEELIKRVKVLTYAGYKIVIAKPKIDTRSKNKIASRNGLSVETHLLDNISDLDEIMKKEHQAIIIDEAQFMQGDVITWCNRQANEGKQIIIAGLDQDYLGNPFGPIPRLLSLAEFVTKLTAICFVCHNAATMTYRKSKKGDLVQIGDLDDYEARCRKCHMQGMKKL